MSILLGIDKASPISPQDAKNAKADVVCCYIGGINNGGWAWQPQHVSSLIKDGSFKLLPIYVGQNVGYAAGNLNGAGGGADAQDTVKCLVRFGIPAHHPVALDIEYGTYENRPSDTIAYANQWAIGVSQAGYTPVVYGTSAMGTDWIPSVPCGFWVANWVVNRPNINNIPISRDHFLAVGWQYDDHYLNEYDVSIFESELWTAQEFKEEDKETGWIPMPKDLPGKVTKDGQRRYFPETHHSIRAGFRAFWEKYGGLPAYGYPISEEFVQSNGVTVQYFQRARFEWHPKSNPDLFDVELGLLGQELITTNGANKTYAGAFAPHNFE